MGGEFSSLSFPTGVTCTASSIVCPKSASTPVPWMVPQVELAVTVRAETDMVLRAVGTVLGNCYVEGTCDLVVLSYSITLK